MTTAQKKTPKDVTIVDRRGNKDITYKTGDIAKDPIWRLFEIYVMDFIANLLPDALVQTQKEFVDRNNRVHVRVDGYIELDEGSKKRKILVEIKHYVSGKIGMEAIRKILRDQKIINPDDYWIIIPGSSKPFSVGVADMLYKKNIKVVRVEKGWEKRIIDLVQKKETPGDEKIVAPTGLPVEWVFNQ